MDHLSIHPVSGVSQFEATRGDLVGLFQRCGHPWSVTAHPDWVSSWWRSRASSSRLVCCLIHDHDALVAAVPLEFSKLPVMTWTSTNLHWGWSSALIDPTTDERWRRTYAQWLGDGAGPWASVQMGLLPIDGPANRQMRAFEGPGHKRFWVRDLASLDLTDSFDAFLDDQSKNLRRKIRRTEKAATENGLSRKVRVQPAPDYLHTVVGAVSSRSWQGTTGRAVYSDPSNREFYRLLTRDPGDLQLVLNHVEAPDGLPIAYVLGVRVADVVHHIDTGFDPEFADYSPGLLATLDAVRWATEQGLATVDLGIDADYKSRFTRDVQRAEGLELTQGAVGFVKRLRPPR